MAKEMMIIFVYDTELTEANETNLSSAIIYFHPNWVSDQQKISLCGQIIGTAHCLKTIFSCPRILALQSGKFCICDYGRYILVVGSDRNIADWVLTHRTYILSSFITFFHRDLESMSDLYLNNNFSTKLYYMLETYLNVLVYGGNMFFNIPSIQLPKSASNVFLEAIQILRACQKINNVLGGAILYHNKVVATQLTSNITKWLILTDPYRIKSPAEMIKTSFQMPVGMQLLQVYIEEDIYEDLKFEATSLQSIHYCLQNKDSNIPTKNSQIKEPVLMTMKRDQSLIFTTVPEEGSDHSTPTVTSKTQRPKFLNLKSKTTDFKQESKESSGPFGSISVCSTPLTDLNRVLHQTSLSICTNPESNTFDTDNISNSQKSDSLNSLLSASSDLHVESAKNGSIKQEESSQDYIVDNNNSCNIKKSFSMTDILKMDHEDNIDEFQRNLRKTIMDPTFPVFTPNGLLISEHLYNYNIFNGELLNMQVKDQSLKAQNKTEIENPNLTKERLTQTDLETNVSKIKFVPAKDNNKFKRSLTLPLKSLSNESGTQQSVAGFNKHAGVQLTPLLSKLSTLAMEERSSGFCSIETTPNDYKDFKSSLKRNPLFRSNSIKVESNTFSSQKDKKLQSAILLIYGQQDMVINLLVEEDAANSFDVVNQIHQTCIDYLTKLEKLIHCCMELCPGGNVQSENSDPYSYLCMNPLWDTIRKGGPWNSFELGALTHLHRDFMNVKNLTEILLRDNDGVIYAHNCGKSEVYYHQSAASNAGLPTPVDPMSIIALKAKRRLERDHAIILH